MLRTSANFKSIFPTGMFAGAAVVVALVLLSAIPCQPPQSEPDSDPTDLHKQQRVATTGQPDEFASPALSPHAFPCSGELWRRGTAGTWGVDPRHPESGVLSVPGAASGGFKLSPRLALFRGRLPASAHPSLHVLLCTWLV
jgi:hypothetical protein